MFKELLTEPKNHNPTNFIYLVHSIIFHEEMNDKINRVRDPNQFYRASMIAHLDSESAKQRIDWDWHGGEVYQMGAFGSIGIIVDPAYNDLVQIAWNCDLGSPCDPKELEEFVQKHRGKIKSPLYLLTQTKGLKDIKYNELILRGYRDTAIKGVFFRSQNSEIEYKGRQLGKIVSELMQSEVPIVELPPVVIDNYDEIKCPEEREMRRVVSTLRGISEANKALLEFYEP
ncbi:MAG: hypothetical protein QW727_01250 [Candidatus Pacearchaeota archaeon]